MAELLLELFGEEIPARMQRPVAEELRVSFAVALKEHQLQHSGVETYITPRRLVLYADGFGTARESKAEEKRGPRTDAPQQAVEGFLRSTGLAVEQLTKRQTPKGEFYFAIVEQKKRPTGEVLTEILNTLIPGLSWPKSMRWGAYDINWVRPLHNICCLFDGKVLPVTFGHIQANDISYGHRFLAPQSFTVKRFSQYREMLSKHYVILDAAERMRAIREQAEILAKAKSLVFRQDEGLLEEVAGLVEWPHVLMGAIPKQFMQVPEEVLIASIRTHQRYFTLRDRKGGLAPHFLVVSNMKEDKEGAIIAGNERVLKARLSDALFFFEQDKKKPLEAWQKDLERVIFHAKLGTLAEKTRRIASNAKFLSMWVPHADLAKVERAALLCKADLATGMVGEFPEVQGIMGYYYAEAVGEVPEVAAALRDHYAPQGPSDHCPSEPVGIAIAIADKVDTLAGLFAVDEQPTGSKDPYALRRAALGVNRIILENKLSVPLKLLIEHALKQYPRSLFRQGNEEQEEEATTLTRRERILGRLRKLRKRLHEKEVVAALLNFFADRLKAALRAENMRHDLINAVWGSGGEDDLLRLVQRVAALDRFLATENGGNLLAAYRRATNIVRIEEKKDEVAYDGSPAKGLLELVEEKELFDKMHDLRPLIKQALKESRFETAMELLARLRRPVDAFFDKVTVNCESPDVRKNRLQLLAQMRELVHDIADFGQIEGQTEAPSEILLRRKQAKSA